MKRTGYISFFLIICLFGFASIPGTLESPTNMVEKKPRTSQYRPLKNYNMEVGYEYEWIDATGGERLNLLNNHYSRKYLGFNFPFYTAQYPTVLVSENGLLGFYGMSLNANNLPFPLTGPNWYNYLIAPFWDDIDLNQGGVFHVQSLYVQSFGDHWVASWNNVWHRSGWYIGSFQVVLYESGDIVFNYQSIGYVGGGYTCGLNYGLDPNYYSSYQGITSRTQSFSIRFTYIEDHDVIATVDFDPDTLNQKSKGKWVTVHIGLPEGYDVNDIDINSVLLDGLSRADSSPTEIADHDGDGLDDLMLKFDREAVIEKLEPGEEVEISVSGELGDGTPFEGTNIISVIH